VHLLDNKVFSCYWCTVQTRRHPFTIIIALYYFCYGIPWYWRVIYNWIFKFRKYWPHDGLFRPKL